MVRALSFAFKIIIGLVVSILLTACSTKDNKRFTVGFLFHDFDVPRWDRERKIFEEKIIELGGEVIVKSAGKNAILQRNQAIELIEKGVKALVVIPVDASSAEIVRIAHDKGVKVISYAGLIPNCDLDYHVEFDSRSVGKLQAEYLLKKVPQGKYVLINADNNSSPFYLGAIETLQPYIDNNQIEIVYSAFIEGWSPVRAAFYTNKIIEFSNVNIDAFLVVNDGMAGGVNKILKKRNLHEGVFITGQDADLAGCARILNGDQNMTVYKPSKLIASQCAVLISKIIRGEKIEGLSIMNNGRKDVPTLFVEPVVVDKSNLESTVVADGIYTMNEISNYEDN